MAEELRNIHRQVLSNGLTIISEEMKHIRSVSIGIWIKTGSRDEEAKSNGISHFIEHMVFKGTRNRSAEAIARQVDSIGGNLDAFTAKECVCFNVKVLDEHLPIAFDVLSDLVLNPVFAAEDIVRERRVILEEIKMDEDNPDYLVHEIFTQNFWKDHPLGKPILGTKETVKGFEQPLVLDLYQKRFTAGNFTIAAAGNLNHKQFVELVAKHFDRMKPATNGFHGAPPKIAPRITLRNKKSLEQVQICVGVPSHPIAHEKRFASYVLNTLLGGGMSSRLFQNIREKQALAYTVYSELTMYRDAGCMMIYAGCSLRSAGRVIDSIVHEMREITDHLVTAEELRRAKDHLKGSFMLGLESTSSRMGNLARQELYFKRFFSLDEMLESIEKVTAEDVRKLAGEFFDPQQTAVAMLGRLEGFRVRRRDLMS